MKKIFVILSAMLALAACSKNGAVTGTAQADDLRLEVIGSAVAVFEADGGDITLTFDTSEPIIASAERPWVSCSSLGNVLTLTAAANKSLNTRYSDLLVLSGDKSCTLTVQQMGKRSIFAPNADWTVSATVTDTYNVTIDVEVADGSNPGPYYLVVLPETTVVDSGSEGDISMFLSLNNNAAVYRKGKTVQSDPIQLDMGVQPRGFYYAIVVGMDGDEPNYTYAARRFGVLYPYDRWLGTWSAVSESGAKSRWTISQKAKDASYTVSGLAGTDYPVEAVFNETFGTLAIYSQEGVATTTRSNEVYDIDLYATASERISFNAGELIFTATLGSDFTSATAKANGSFTGFTFIQSLDGEPMYYDGNRENPIPATLTKEEE